MNMHNTNSLRLRRPLKRRGSFLIFVVAVLALLSVIAVLVLFAGTGADVPIESIVPLGVGLLFLILGNYMGKVRKNFFIGTRTPWTLASDEVWARTHRLGGWVFMLSGILLMGAAFLPGMMIPLVVAVVIAAFAPVVYSYVLYRRLEGFRDKDAR